MRLGHELGFLIVNRDLNAVGANANGGKLAGGNTSARHVSLHGDEEDGDAYRKICCFGLFCCDSGCIGGVLALAGNGFGGNGNCGHLPSNGMLRDALKTAVGKQPGNGGLATNMWATIVDSSGIVCAVAFSGADYTSQRLGSRVISAQKANTGNAFSLGLRAGGTVIALSSAKSLFGGAAGRQPLWLQASNRVKTDVAYGNQPGHKWSSPLSTPTPSICRRIRWSASASAASMYSAAALRPM